MTEREQYRVAVDEIRQLMADGSTMAGAIRANWSMLDGALGHRGFVTIEKFATDIGGNPGSVKNAIQRLRHEQKEATPSMGQSRPTSSRPVAENQPSASAPAEQPKTKGKLQPKTSAKEIMAKRKASRAANKDSDSKTREAEESDNEWLTLPDGKRAYREHPTVPGAFEIKYLESGVIDLSLEKPE